MLGILAIISEKRERTGGNSNSRDSSTKVSENGTKFLTAGISHGATFRIDAIEDYACEVASVVSDTEIQLVRPY